MSQIVATDLGVRFWFDGQQRVTTPIAARLRRSRSETWGIRHIAFSARGGEGIALIGPSGAGKTTLLRVLAGVQDADEGEVVMHGRTASLLAPNAGLMRGLTGRENTRLLAVLGGLSRREARAASDGIGEATKLGDAFDRNVSSLSLGMRARLGFGVAELLQPKILLLDEIHDALDEEFRQRVAERARAIVASGGIVVAAGHDHANLRPFCSRALCLIDGAIAADGEFELVRDWYLERAAELTAARDAAA